MKFELFNYKSVTSTNDVAINLIRKKNFLSGCVLASNQTKGRGTYGKKWISKNGNLFASIFFHLKNEHPSFKEFSCINPILLIDVIKNYCDERKLLLKFPNDILYRKKKICGLLQEFITENKKNFLIIGIGLNIISNPIINNRYKATNIFSETKKKPSIIELLNLIILSYEKFFENLDQYNYEDFKTKGKNLSLTK